MHKALALGTLSGILLVLAAPPLSTPLLGFLAFAPLAYLAARGASLKSLFSGSFIAGAAAGGALSFSVFRAFTWPADDPAALTVIHWNFIPWALLMGAVFGGGIAWYGKFRAENPFFNAALFAALYSTFEAALQLATGHYYIGALAYSVTYLPTAMSLASLGGEALVSYSIAFIAAFIGECIALPHDRRLRVLLQAAGCAAALVVLCAANEYYLQPAGPLQDVRIASIQTGSRDASAFAHDYDGSLSFPALAEEFKDSAASSTDLIVYPLAVANEVIYTDAPPQNGYGDLRFLPRSALESWMEDNAPASSTIVTWDITYSGGKYLQNYDYWNGGSLAAVYSKRFLYAFTEYTPTFAHFGFGPTPAPISAGESGGVTRLGAFSLSNLQCSEVHLASLARDDANNAQLFLNIGLEWIFPGDLGEEYSLKAAQYRAAENNIPAIRATIEGPSALIDPRGHITRELGFEEEGILRGALAVPPAHRTTLYSLLGSYPLYAGVALVIVAAILRRRKSAVKSPDTAE